MLLLPASWLLSEVGSEIGSIGVHCFMQAMTDESQGTAVAQPMNLNMLEHVTILTKRANNVTKALGIATMPIALLKHSFSNTIHDAARTALLTQKQQLNTHSKENT